MRGIMISAPSILRAAVTRFIPGVLLFLGCGLYFTARIKGITLGPEQIDGLTALTLFMALGFVVILVPIRRILRSTASVTGRTGVLAGFASPSLLLGLEML